MTKHFILIFSAVMLVFGCSGQDASDLMQQASALQKEGKSAEALALYEQITREYDETSAAPEAMFHCALIYVNDQKDPVKAATTYELLAEKYPDSEWGHKGLFAAAYTYANEIGNLQRARESYQKYLTQYPDSSMAETAQFELQNLGKSAEELLESIQQSQDAMAEGGDE